MKSKLQYKKTNIKLLLQSYITSYTWTFMYVVKRENDNNKFTQKHH